MHHQSTSEQHSFFSHQKGLSMLADGLRERELLMKRDQIITSILEDAPKSFSKLIYKDIYGKQVQNQDKSKILNKYSGGHTSQVRSKHAQKTFFRALQEEQRLISRQNMQLLGLTIQKIGCMPKSKRIPGQISDPVILTMQPSQVLNLQNCENIPQNENMQSILDKKMMLPRKVRTMNKRPQSIRLRRKEIVSPQRRRSSMHPISNEYQNTVYEGRIQSYRELLFKLQWSYGIYSQMDCEQQLKAQKKYKVWIGNGNNSHLIRQLMKRRFWWQITEDKNSMDVNFIWTQLRVNQYFDRQGQAPLWFMNEGVKKPEQKDRQNKEGLVKDVSRDLKVRSKSKKDKDKQKQILKDEQNLYKIMPSFEIANYHGAVRFCRLKPIYQRQSILNLKEFTSESQKMHNHLTANFHLGNKKALFYNLKQYYDLTSGNLFKTIPLTFHIKKGMKDPQYKRFMAYHKKRQTAIKRQQRQMENGQIVKRPLRNIWIVKPGEITNRGHGITVIDEVYELDAIIKAEKKHDNGTQKTFIVQLYIDRPFLYKRRKFDIRHYVMISQIHGVFKAYWYRQGYIRTSSYQFDVYNFDRQIHLTNDAIQKNTPLYGRYQQANKISYAQFQKYLDAHYKDKYNFQKDILSKMKQIALDSIKSVFVKISPQRKKHNFQVFGLDFMIDGNFNPWLIQINTNPCLQLNCPLLTRIVPQMLDQAFRLTLDVVYPPPTHYPNTAKHLVPDASLQALKWQLIFDQRLEGQKLRQLYRRCRPDLLAQIGAISDQQTFQESNRSPQPLQQELL